MKTIFKIDRKKKHSKDAKIQNYTSVINALQWNGGKQEQ